jgi:hypothetical protein
VKSNKEILVIDHQLSEFDFHCTRKILKFKRYAQFTSYRGEMFPFIKYFKHVKVTPIPEYLLFLPIVYWESLSLKLGYITKVNQEDVIITSLKFFPHESCIKKKHILGRINLSYPFFIFKVILKHRIKTGRFKLMD